MREADPMEKKEREPKKKTPCQRGIAGCPMKNQWRSCEAHTCDGLDRCDG